MSNLLFGNTPTSTTQHHSRRHKTLAPSAFMRKSKKNLVNNVRLNNSFYNGDNKRNAARHMAEANVTHKQVVSPASSPAAVGSMSHLITRFKSPTLPRFKPTRPSLNPNMAASVASVENAIAAKDIKPFGGRYTTRRKHIRKKSSGKKTYKQRNTRKR